MGDWLLDVQDPDGGAGEAVGAFAAHPRIFNTSQVMLGWIALSRETGDGRYAEAAERAGRWLTARQDDDGKWSRDTFAGPRSYHARTAWALLELAELTGRQTYRDAAEHTVEWVLGCAQETGWFDRTSLEDPERPWTHLIAYTLVGLAKVAVHHSRCVDAERVLRPLRLAAAALAATWNERAARTPAGTYVGLPGRLDRDWRGTDAWSCLTGDAQTGFFLGLIGREDGDAALLETAGRMREDLKRVHRSDAEEPGLRGGLCGSHPIGGGYAGYAVPNWAVKFLADFLLQDVLPPEALRDLG